MAIHRSDDRPGGTMRRRFIAALVGAATLSRSGDGHGSGTGRGPDTAEGSGRHRGRASDGPADRRHLLHAGSRTGCGPTATRRSSSACRLRTRRHPRQRGVAEPVRRRRPRARPARQKVDLIGHSQGGLVGRYYIKNLGGATEVDSLISLASLHYGTAVANLGALLGLGNCIGIVGCEQMTIGSSLPQRASTPATTRSATSPTPTSPPICDELVIPVHERLPAQRRQQHQRHRPGAMPVPVRRARGHRLRRHGLQRHRRRAAPRADPPSC